MSKKNFIAIPIALFMVIILLQYAYSDTFWIRASDPRISNTWTSCNMCGVVSHYFYTDCNDISMMAVCCQCHANKPAPNVKISTKESANRHLKERWPQNEYRLAEGQKIGFENTNAYVIQRKGRLVLYINKRASVLPERAKIIKAGNRFFILE